MESWGFNPATMQAIGGIATAFALVFVIRSSLAARRSSVVASRESSFRTRPWIGLAGAEFKEGVSLEDVDPDDLDESDDLESPPDILTLKFSSMGPVPAQKRSIELRLKPKNATDWEMRPFRSQIGAFFPNEPSTRHYRFTGERGALLNAWKNSKLEVIYEGRIRYSFGDEDGYATSFSGRLRFDLDGRRTWRNDEAI